MFLLAVPQRIPSFFIAPKSPKNSSDFYQIPCRSSRVRAWLVAGLFLLFFQTPALAFPEDSPQSGLLGLSAGAVGIEDSFQLSFFSLDYTFNKRFWALVPHAGLLITTQTAVYAYAGLGLEFCPYSRWMIIPRVSVGLYNSFSNQSLGNTVEFLSSLELAYRFKDQSRLGLVFGHMSNARLGAENPGTDFLYFTYTIPVDLIFRLSGS